MCCLQYVDPTNASLLQSVPSLFVKRHPCTNIEFGKFIVFILFIANKMNTLKWLYEVSKYDMVVVIKFWLKNRDFLEERSIWVNEMK